MLDTKMYEGFVEDFNSSLRTGVNNKIDDEIKKRITLLGVDVTNTAYIQRNFRFIEKEGDDFKHLFYIPENKFIISIQKVPTIDFTYETEDIANNKVTCTASYKYY